MLINKASLDALFTNLKTTFNKAFGATETTWQQIAMEVPSTGAQNDYSWLSNFPKMRKWIGEKVIKSLEAFKYTVVNDDWEATIEVDRNHIEDDALGMYATQAQGAGESAAQLPDEIVYDLVNGAFARECYDGQYYCDTDHPVGDGNGGIVSVSNRGTVALSVASQAAVTASYGAARTAMMMFKDDEGRPLGVVPNVLLVGPALEPVALAIANNERLQDGVINPYKGTCKVVVSPRITSTTAWFLLDTSKAVKPFIYQKRKAPTFVQQTDMSSDSVYLRKKFRYGAEARAAGGYGFWQLCWGSTGAG